MTSGQEIKVGSPAGRRVRPQHPELCLGCGAQDSVTKSSTASLSHQEQGMSSRLFKVGIVAVLMHPPHRDRIVHQPTHEANLRPFLCREELFAIVVGIIIIIITTLIVHPRALTQRKPRARSPQHSLRQRCKREEHVTDLPSKRLRLGVCASHASVCRTDGRSPAPLRA
eukprot:981125-Rhodomonas_salina.1